MNMCRARNIREGGRKIYRRALVASVLADVALEVDCHALELRLALLLQLRHYRLLWTEV
jgi:hypothetical protein